MIYKLPRKYRLILTDFELGELMGAMALLEKIRLEFAREITKRLEEAYRIVYERQTYPGVKQLERN